MRPVAGRGGPLDERRVTVGSDWTYSWNQRVPSGAAAATSSIERDEVVESVNGIPAAAAARAVAISPSGWASPWTAIGAIATGMAVGAPRSVVEGSIPVTSTRTRGRRRRRRQAASFSARVTSSQAPPAT